MDNHEPPSPVKARPSATDRRARQADRLTTIRLRMAIWRELHDRGVTGAAGVGEALGLPAAAAAALLARHQWRAGDVALLQAAAARLGVPDPGAG
jgi:hypothetical protein